jgi:hypothetical protein
MKTRGFLLVAIVLVAVIGLAVLGGCKKDEPVKEEPVEGKVSFVNTNCPIMTASVIDPAKVTADLITEFKGEKIAFCCADCPEQWDALSDEDKIAKLASSK